MLKETLGIFYWFKTLLFHVKKSNQSERFFVKSEAWHTFRVFCIVCQNRSHLWSALAKLTQTKQKFDVWYTHALFPYLNLVLKLNWLVFLWISFCRSYLVALYELHHFISLSYFVIDLDVQIIAYNLVFYFHEISNSTYNINGHSEDCSHFENKQ